jgi:hypothetical protein
MLAMAFPALSRALLLIVLAVALTATGFAHRIPSAKDGALAFALANGADAADFCGGSFGREGAVPAHCPACQIVGGADLPSPAGQPIRLQDAVLAAVIAPGDAPALRAPRDPAHGPQGPPVA